MTVVELFAKLTPAQRAKVSFFPTFTQVLLYDTGSTILEAYVDSVTGEVVPRTQATKTALNAL